MRFELGSSRRIAGVATTLAIAATIVFAAPTTAAAAIGKADPPSACAEPEQSTRLEDPKLFANIGGQQKPVEKLFIAWAPDASPPGIKLPETTLFSVNGGASAVVLTKDGDTSAVDKAITADNDHKPGRSEVIVVGGPAAPDKATSEQEDAWKLSEASQDVGETLIAALRNPSAFYAVRTSSTILVCTDQTISSAAAARDLTVEVQVDGQVVDPKTHEIPTAASTGGKPTTTAASDAQADLPVVVNVGIGNLQLTIKFDNLRLSGIVLQGVTDPSVPQTSTTAKPEKSTSSTPRPTTTDAPDGDTIKQGTGSASSDSKNGGKGIIAGFLGLVIGAAIGAGVMYLILRNRSQHSDNAEGDPYSGGAPIAATGPMFLGAPSDPGPGPAPVVPSNSVYEPIAASPAWQHRSNRDAGTGRPMDLVAEAPGVYSMSGAHPIGLMASVWCEKAVMKGEDAVPLIMLARHSNSFVVAVADGMGGSGSTVVAQLVTGEPVTSASIAAAATIRAVATTATNAPADNPLSPDMLQQAISSELAALTRRYGKPSVGGSLVRSFPTTLAAAAVAPSNGSNTIDVVWAGDSRVYWLSPRDGLHPLTADDVEPRQDDLALLRSDPKMRNFISADRPFRLNHTRRVLPTPGILISATDGVFGYLPSPIHVELTFLQALAGHDRSTWDDRQKQLTHALRSVAKDDLSMTITAIGFQDVESLTRAYGDRLDALTRFVTEAQIADGGDTARIDMAWQRYCHTYESLMPS